jgi:uracil-DNA glycosylase family 4
VKARKKDTMFKTHGNCVSCPMHEFPRSVGMATHHLAWSLPPGPETPAIVMIGQNPGYQEDREGIPFVGPSGRLVRDVYIKGTSLHTRSAIYLTNICRCATEANSPPRLSNLKACAPYTLRDLDIITYEHNSAKVLVLCLGAPAVNGFFKYVLQQKGSVSLKQGFSLNGETVLLHFVEMSAPLQFFCTYHPAYLLRDPRMISTIHDHLGLVSDCLSGTMASPSAPSVIAPTHPSKLT